MDSDYASHNVPFTTLDYIKAYDCVYVLSKPIIPINNYAVTVRRQ